MNGPISCPHCQELVALPPGAPTSIHCPHCAQVFSATESAAPSPFDFTSASSGGQPSSAVPRPVQKASFPGNLSPIGMVGLGVGVVIGIVVSRLVFSALMGTNGPFFADQGWSVQKLGRMSFEAPFAFKPVPNLPLPAEVLQTLESMEFIQNTPESKRGYVAVMRMTGKPGTPMSLEGAMDGAMRNGAATASKQDRSSIRYQSNAQTVSGLPARRASFTGKRNGASFTLEGLFIEDGQTLWMVSVGHETSVDAERAKRLLDSVKIAK